MTSQIDDITHLNKYANISEASLHELIITYIPLWLNAIVFH